MIIRPSQETDAQALADIYGHHVLHGFGFRPQLKARDSIKVLKIIRDERN